MKIMTLFQIVNDEKKEKGIKISQEELRQALENPNKYGVKNCSHQLIVINLE
jgi:hypothetical protein